MTDRNGREVPPRPDHADRATIVIGDRSAADANELTDFLQRDADLGVVAVCANVESLLLAIEREQPDLVALDIDVPSLSGVAAIERIMRTRPTRIVGITASGGRDSERAATALAAGALDVVSKDAMRSDSASSLASAALRRRIKRLARTRLKPGPEADGMRTEPGMRATARERTIIGICASTGGPPALTTILAGLPANFALPILVVQHMTAGFVDGLVRRLDADVALPVRIAEAGVRPGLGVWFAPDGAHLALDPLGRMTLDRETAWGNHRPSGDVMLNSIAATAGSGAVAVVLTGMGRDGAAGMAAVRTAGGLTIAQDEATSAVFGMPRAAADEGAELILPLRAIAGQLAALRARSAT